MPDDLRQEEYELLARIAHRYYVDDSTQEEIAREFGLSRPKVQRLLDRARRAGVVDIHIQAPPGLNLDLEDELRRTFKLTDAIVGPPYPDAQAQREAVARCAARYLERRLADGSVVAVSHGRDTGALPRFFHPDRRIDCTFVSAMGGSPNVDAPTNPNEISRALAERSGGRAVSLYAPAYVERAEIRDELRQQETVAHTLRLAAGADIALVGIGGTDDDCTMVRSGCLSMDEMARLRSQGAVGDVLGNYVDMLGRPVSSPHQERLIALTVEDLRRIRTAVAVVSEVEKPRAVLGVLRSGVVDVLVVDEPNARAVLALAREDGLGEGRRGSGGSGSGAAVPAGEVVDRRV
ncbi:MAG: sugar-binding transcriptional regulator [Chloroflexi bacterium]|nr:sugar-binding transcriptional regulator [Chloroflexota bacterium]